MKTVSSPAAARATTAPSSRLLEAAMEVVGSEASALAWLESPQRGLGYRRPVDFAASFGDSEVLSLLGRIEHGVYS